MNDWHKIFNVSKNLKMIQNAYHESITLHEKLNKNANSVVAS
jgi:hypothetical protein